MERDADSLGADMAGIDRSERLVAFAMVLAALFALVGAVEGGLALGMEP
jgi:hypothetical protein